MLMKYQDPIKLSAYGEGELNQKWPNYLSWTKISKILLLCAVFWGTIAQAKDADYPDLNDEGEFSLMGTLSDLDWHNLKDERWNAYSQATYIASFKPSFPAAYTNLNDSPNSLSPYSEYGFTATFTSYLGLKA